MARITIALLLLAHPKPPAPGAASPTFPSACPISRPRWSRTAAALLSSVAATKTRSLRTNGLFAPRSRKKYSSRLRGGHVARGLDAPRKRYRHAAATDGRSFPRSGVSDVAENLVPQRTPTTQPGSGHVAAEVPRSDCRSTTRATLALAAPHPAGRRYNATIASTALCRSAGSRTTPRPLRTTSARTRTAASRDTLNSPATTRARSPQEPD